MTGIPLAQGRKFPEVIHQLGEAAQKHGKNWAKASDETAAIRNASTAQGAAGEAARDALSHSVTTFDGAKMKAHELALDAWAVENHATKVKQDIDQLLADAEAKPYPCHIDDVSNTVTPPVIRDDMDKKDQQAAEKKYVEIQNRLLQVVAELETVSEEFAVVIREATNGEIPPGVKEGSEDAQAVKAALRDGKPIPPEVLDRIGQITNLSEADKKAWEAGRLTIPQSSMDYLNSFSRSLDGQSIGQLKDMMNKMPEPDAKNVMNGFQMISDPKVQAPGPKGMKGSLDRLPDGMRNVASMPDSWKGDPSKVMLPNGIDGLVKDRQDLAAIMQKGSADFMHGSDLDKAVLKQVDVMMDFRRENDGITALSQTSGGDQVIQDMLHAAGRDQWAVHDVVAGTDGKTPNNDFIGELLNHQYWNDGGAAAGTLVDGIPDVANDATQAGAAQRAGETVHAFDQYMGTPEHSKELASIKLSDGTTVSFGEKSPEFAKALGEANAPFTDDMVDRKTDNTRGFEPLDTVRGRDANMPHTRDALGLMETNPDAAKALHGSVDQNALALQQQYADSVIDGRIPEADALRAAGQLQGLDDVASSMAHAHDGKLDYENAMRMFQDKSEAFELFKSVGGQIPEVKDTLDAIKNMPGGDSMLKDMLLGAPPEKSADAHIPIKDSTAVQYHIAQRLFEQGYGDKTIFSDEFPTYEQAKDSGRIMDRISHYLRSGVNEQIDVNVDINQWGNAYRDAMPSTPPPFGSK
ncbi:TPR repeat region-containing protein [Mycobacteroides abscessus]|uniref:TPR repeat region-containing protein n=1 Tax=Mycobacteroides abscessus TaxID=36809 RepID=UPI000927B6FE|nr:hypothetical protein [Mycobacteroides abscessus]SHW33497.1 Uncharacterised protein [Mycobacteroides abscessus subsp. abscessus]SIA06400.1 Uncharacterised protein [Mycobacteroides abscessus subsp. abscessus]SKR55473.1 Uncharacterised protein [Mycobacteroides abscessus subsp. abscessus]